MADLFNEKTLKRIVEESGIVLSKVQKEAAKKWIKLLEEKELEAEKSNNHLFMKDILSDILGYPFEEIDYEKENVEFSIKKDGKRKLIIETKGTKTNLEKSQKRFKGEHSTPIKQLFDYMNSDATPFGILTNYEEFMLFDYSKGQNTSYKFNFLDIKTNPEKLKEFILIFSKSSLIDENKTEKIKQESELEEKKLTDKFYKIYHETRLMMLKEFEEYGNSHKDSLHYAQLFLNRLMFVYFAEDINLIPRRVFETNLMDSLKNYSTNSSNACDSISVLFEDLDKGDKNKEIQQFNGGLFRERLSRDAYFKDIKPKFFFKGIYAEKKNLEKDLSLSPEELIIFNKAKKDGLNPIIENMLLMASFDFKSDLKVNILGHIFEQSLSDLEEIEGSNASKRKKDGIFYTPEYITDYICRNTIIPYLSKSGVNDTDKLIEEYSHDIEVLEDKFRKIKIVDPACGSGAFLIKAVDILFEISEKIQDLKQSWGEYQAERGLKRKSNISGQLTFEKFEEKDRIREIIENNIYGVDLNEESIETTKLSLFLRIAKKGKKLPDLSDHIKCGNSLIEDEEVAGEKAFDWKEQFKDVFENGGFDVVVGNPPYVRQELIKEIKPNLEKNYISYNGVADLFVYFFEKGLNLLKEKGKFAFIVSNKFTRAGYGKNLREYLLDNSIIEQYIDTFDANHVFEGVTVDPCIIILEKNKENKENKILYNYKTQISQLAFDSGSWSFGSDSKIKLLEKIKNSGERLRDVIGEAKSGIKTGLNDVLIVDSKKIKEIINGNEKEKEVFVPFIKGEDIKRWKFEFNDNYLIFLEEKKIGDFPNVKEYLTKHKKRLESRSDIKGKNRDWFGLRACAYYDLYKKPKIVWPDISQGMNFAFDEEKTYLEMTAFFLETDNKYFLTLLNSKVLEFYFRSIGSVLGKKGYRLKRQYVHELPIKQISPSDQKPFIEKADEMLNLNKEFYEKKNKSLNRIKELGVEKISKKLENFFLLNFEEFVNELSKQKIKLNLKQKDEWEDYFDKYKKELSLLRENIDSTDKEIDQMVYALYGLDEKEIKVVEDSLK